MTPSTSPVPFRALYGRVVCLKRSLPMNSFMTFTRASKSASSLPATPRISRPPETAASSARQLGARNLEAKGRPPGCAPESAEDDAPWLREAVGTYEN